MPNHITNIVRAPKHVLDSLKSEDREVDFNTAAPYPEELKDLMSEYQVFPTESQAQAYNTIQREKFASFPAGIAPGPEAIHAISKQTHERLTSIYGDNLDWYSWNTRNWGTKWNAYSIERLNDTTVLFETAWATPSPVFKALAEKFPDAEIRVLFADEDFGYNLGGFVLRDGAVSSTMTPEQGSLEAYAWAARVRHDQSLAKHVADYIEDYDSEEEYWAENPDMEGFEAVPEVSREDLFANLEVSA